MNEAFFGTVFPSIVGHGNIIDEFIADPRAEYYRICKHKKIVVGDPNDEDRDWKVKHCYTLMIAAAGELKYGVDNLWKKGIIRGRRSYPNFGQYIPKNVFKAFFSVAPYACCDNKFGAKIKMTRHEIFLYHCSTCSMAKDQN
eukprot:11440414-Ditylum_brightwellii.AAC.1